jgi:hypothetical protein
MTRWRPPAVLSGGAFQRMRPKTRIVDEVEDTSLAYERLSPPVATSRSAASSAAMVVETLVLAKPVQSANRTFGVDHSASFAPESEGPKLRKGVGRETALRCSVSQCFSARSLS